VPIPLDDIRVIDRDERQPALRVVAVDRVAAFLEHLLDETLCCTNGVAGIAHESRLGVSPLVQVAIASRRRKLANSELVTFSLGGAQPFLGRTRSDARDRAVVLVPEPIAEV
jgi:hypothetical protein